MRRIPSSCLVVELWTIAHQADESQMTIVHPDGSQDYNPNMAIHWYIECTMSDDTVKRHPISSYDVEQYERLCEVEAAIGSQGDLYIERILRNAGFELPEYEYDENDF